ncbi:MAG TPA: trigger factor [Candidatus Saccharimonadales bacterium]|nr:trigger factor [Candidatus Saccharimonadales bacterium]
MQVHKTQVNPTTVKLNIEADQLLLEDVRTQVLKRLSRSVKLQGFRPGKAPLALVEKNVDQSAYQSEFIDTALNRMYGEALADQKVRPVAQPKVQITKFVPFTTLEFEAEVEAIGAVKLPDYTKIKLDKKPVEVTDKDVDAVLENLQIRMSEKQEVDRASKDGDEVWIDFEGRDAKTGEAIQGADGKDYPLLLGSNTFIPGFEPNLVGLKPGEDKEFTLTFPEDYGVKALQNREVTFKATVTKVKEVVKPKVDDEFAAKVGPFKSAAELKSDIKKSIVAERQQQNDREYESDLLGKITEQAEVAVPKALVDEEITRLEREERQNVAYRGQTWQEHLAEEGLSEEEHRDKNRPGAETRVKAGLVLAEIAEKEQIDVTREELQERIAQLKTQYTDATMQAELDKPENQRELASRIMSEKTLGTLVQYATAKPAAKKAAKEK